MLKLKILVKQMIQQQLDILCFQSCYNSLFFSVSNVALTTGSIVASEV